MIDLIVDFLATIGDIIVDIWVNKIVTKFQKEMSRLLSNPIVQRADKPNSFARPFLYRSCSCRLVRLCVCAGWSERSAISTHLRIF